MSKSGRPTVIASIATLFTGGAARAVVGAIIGAASSSMGDANGIGGLY